MQQRYTKLLALADLHQPATVRGIYYQATVARFIDKDDQGYDLVGKALVKMRKRGDLPYNWIVDLTRRVNKPLVFDDPADAIDWLVCIYREDLWRDQPVQVQVWLEKAALEGVIEQETRDACVPLMVSRGFSSITFLEDCARQLDPNKPAWIFHLGDSDKSGREARDAIERWLRERHPDLHFIPLAVTDEQAKTLPSRPGKRGEGEVVELDAIAPNDLRALVRDALQKLMPDELRWELLGQENQRRNDLIGMANKLARKQS